MAFDPTIDLGNVLVITTMIVSMVSVIAGVRIELRSMKEIMLELAKRLDRHEEKVFIMAGQVQRLIGRLDETPWPPDRPDQS